MPWVVTQVMLSSVSLASSDRFRTFWKPGRTSTPLPVTILNPMLSPTPSTGTCLKPEMIKASLGSATRHMARKVSRTTSSAPRTAPATMRMRPRSACMCGIPPLSLGGADVDGARREVLDDDHPGPRVEGLPRLCRMGEEGLGSPTDGGHPLPGAARTDAPCDPADLADDRVIVAVDDVPCHGSPMRA